MKSKLILTALLSISLILNAQQITNGPNLDNDRDNKLNRMLDGDNNTFYTYRIRAKGRGTSYFVEKYNKEELKPIFSKEIEIEEDRYTKVEDVKYAADNVTIFIRQYNKKENKMSLYYRSVSSSGSISPKLEELLFVNTDHYEFIDFDIYQNPSKTKYLLKVSYKENKEDHFKTKFITYDAQSMKQIASKQVDQQLFSGVQTSFSIFGYSILKNTEFIGLMLDDDDNIYYGYNYFDKNSTEKDLKYKVAINILSKNSITPQTVELQFDENYFVGNIKFTKPNPNHIVAGGFLKDVIERRGRDLVKTGIFSFSVNIETARIESKTVNIFDDKILFALESNPKRSQFFKYKLDYIIPSGNDVFYIGEQYREQEIVNYNPSTHMTETHWEYEYMDVITAKLNARGEFEWIKNTPLRITMSLSNPHVFKQYIAFATSKAIYILNDEHPKNLERYAKPDFEPRDLKSIGGIHGTNFVSSSIDLATGNVTHKLIFENEDYCFAPVQERNFAYMPPPETENFVKGKENEIYIYTENRGKDRFSKLTFE